MRRNLIDHALPVLREFGEYKALMEAEQQQIDTLWNLAHAFLDEALVDRATGEGLKRWEKILGITCLDTDEVRVRRLRIQAKIMEDVPYTEAVLRNILTGLCGEENYTIDVKYEEYRVTIRVALVSKKMKDEVITMAERVVPANMILDIDLMYNTYGILGGYTHRQLREYTHRQLRNEVLL